MSTYSPTLDWGLPELNWKKLPVSPYIVSFSSLKPSSGTLHDHLPDRVSICCKLLRGLCICGTRRWKDYPLYTLFGGACGRKHKPQSLIRKLTIKVKSFLTFLYTSFLIFYIYYIINF